MKQNSEANVTHERKGHAMAMILRSGIFAMLAAMAISGNAFAQSGGGAYQLTEINFDTWCQETRHLPPERCDKRLPEDDAEFEAYVSKIESYEIPYLQQKRDQEYFNRTVIHSDPIDRPTQPSAPPTPPN
jgi:hypothetical protein